MQRTPPYWAVDPYRWDMYKTYFTGRSGEVRFDVTKEATVQHLISAINQRGSRLYIGFTYYDPKTERDFEEDVIQIAQFGKNICHSCVWFREHVTTLATSTEEGIVMTQSPLEYGKWELVSLPFCNVPLAFRIGVDIVLKCNKEDIHYEPQTWHVLCQMLTRLLVPGSRSEGASYDWDYDPEKPETWTRGIHCSQLTLLFLKRCVVHNALFIPNQHRRRFIGINTFTCLPAMLRALLTEIWGGMERIEFRDYREIGDDIRKSWYPSYYYGRETESLK